MCCTCTAPAFTHFQWPHLFSFVFRIRIIWCVESIYKVVVFKSSILSRITQIAALLMIMTTHQRSNNIMSCNNLYYMYKRLKWNLKWSQRLYVLFGYPVNLQGTITVYIKLLLIRPNLTLIMRFPFIASIYSKTRCPQ